MILTQSLFLNLLAESRAVRPYTSITAGSALLLSNHLHAESFPLKAINIIILGLSTYLTRGPGTAAEDGTVVFLISKKEYGIDKSYWNKNMCIIAQLLNVDS